MTESFRSSLSRFLSDYGMLLILLLLCLYYSWVTWAEQHPNGVAGAEQLAQQIIQKYDKRGRVLIVARDNPEDAAFADTLYDRLLSAGIYAYQPVKGQPADVRAALEGIGQYGGQLTVIAANDVTSRWAVFDDLPELAKKYPALAKTIVLTPRSYWWPNFLKTDNLLNVANQIVVIAILAIGMTMVIITGGIDLSVGSLIALSAVVATWLIRDVAGAEKAGALGMWLSCLAGLAAGGLMGLFSGLMVTFFTIPPFIATLGMMLVASGLAYIIAEGQSIYQMPDSFIWLGRGADLFDIPNAVVLMAILYAAAHFLMNRVRLGRYIYAVGGNREAARLSGVPVQRVLLFVYTISGAGAGLGGIVMASQLKSGAPTYGLMYELYTIAAVVVGGTSLAGGEGKILGTLIGAFIIAVIQNGMNLTGVESYTQKVVLGLVILGAVLLDMLKKRNWNIMRRDRLPRQ
jgi:ribose transport system permease protein